MAVWLTNHSQPDVVILDVNLPGIGGVEACRQIKQQHRKLPILVLTSLFQKSLITRLIDVGVQGFCLKGLKVKVLLLAVRSLAAGASWWDQVGTAQIREVFQTYHSNSTVTETINSLRASNLIQLKLRKATQLNL
jgi:DNA-binding NarL/FixJ family response regulator